MRTLLAALLLVPAVATADEAPRAGGIIAGAKLGGIAPFTGLSPWAMFGLEAGYAFGGDLPLAIVLNVDYTQPTRTGSETDPRVMGGTYSWKLTEQMLGIMPVLLLDLPKLGTLQPYMSIGPRFLLIRSTVDDDGTPAFMETTEESTRFGFAYAVGGELRAGPGRVTGELLFQYGTLHHVATGNSHTGALSLSVGYRFRM